MLKMEKRIELTAKEKKLHEEALAYARQHSDSEYGLCRVLRNVEQNLLYRKFGYARVFFYAVQELGLSEHVASATITVARKTKEIPELRRAVDEGKLSVSKASRLVSGITAENAKEVIAFAQTHTSNEINAEMARRNPGKPRRDRNRPIGNDMVELRAQISTETNKKLKRAESLLASKGKATNLDCVLNASLELYLDRHDPVRKAERAQARAAKKAEQNATRSERKTTKTERSSGKTEQYAPRAVQDTEQNADQNAGSSNQFCSNSITRSTPHDRRSSLVDALIGGPSHGDTPVGSDSPGDSSIYDGGDQPSFKAGGKAYHRFGDKPSSKHGAREREHIKAKTNHTVMLRTGGQCDFVNERGERSPEDRYLHIHHIVPLSQGGTDDPSNLTCLCSGHHALVHQLSFAIDGQITWLRSPQAAYHA